MTTPKTEKRTRVRSDRTPRPARKAAAEDTTGPVGPVALERSPDRAAPSSASRSSADAAGTGSADLAGPTYRDPSTDFSVAVASAVSDATSSSLSTDVSGGAAIDVSALPAIIDLDTPRDGVPLVISNLEGLLRAAAALAGGTGPAAVDAERASGFRYGQRAFLIQIRREGAGTWLIDPEPLQDLSVINDALHGVEWILHAASQDLPCLAELGMWPDKLFDTELAARLAGLPRVGLAAVIEQLLGFGLAKEHSAADWSTRPLPEPWLRYAALDVEVLVELREELVELLQTEGKLGWAEEEFAAILAGGVAGPRVDPWRRTSGVHQLRDRRQLAAVRELWQERDQLAQKRDVAPGRLIPDSALVAAAKAMPSTVPALLTVKGFHGRASKREAPRWLRAIATARELDELPPMHLATNAPPPPRVWVDRDPVAAARLATAKLKLAELAEELNMPAENLLTPDHLRRLAWRPPAEINELALSDQLAALGARAWQISATMAALTEAFLNPGPLPVKEKAGNAVSVLPVHDMPLPEDSDVAVKPCGPGAETGTTEVGAKAGSASLEAAAYDTDLDTATDTGAPGTAAR